MLCGVWNAPTEACVCFSPRKTPFMGLVYCFAFWAYGDQGDGEGVLRGIRCGWWLGGNQQSYGEQISCASAAADLCWFHLALLCESLEW